MTNMHFVLMDEV